MYVTIRFGDNRMEILNLNCKLIHFILHLKERCGLDSKECVELMDSRGRLMNLEGNQHSWALTSSLLPEKQCYFLLRVCRDDDTGGRKYVSLLNNFDRTPSELSELLRKLSIPDRERDRKIRGGRTQRSTPAKQSRVKNNKSDKKQHMQ